jgi:hypothetical protein
MEFDDFSDEDLFEILSQKCVQLAVRAPLSVKQFAVQKLARLRALPNFGNAGTLNTMLNDAMSCMSDRINHVDGRVGKRELCDGDFEHDASGGEADPLEQLKKFSGMHALQTRVEQLASQIQVRAREGRALKGIVGNWIFTGNPGTGKTTIAKLFGKILHGFGLLATPDVKVTSALDLTGQYVGQTKEKVQEMMSAARGSVLFIDEAYELGRGGFGNDALTKLLSLLTEDEHKDGNTIVIMAGYEEQMHDMLARNPGLKSRFTEFLDFPDWSARDSAAFVVKRLTQDAEPVPFVLQDKDATLESLERGVAVLKARSGWANVRDLLDLSQKVAGCRDVRVGGLDAESTAEAKAVLLCDVDDAIQAFLEKRPEVVEPITHFGMELGDAAKERTDTHNAPAPQRVKHAQRQREEKVSGVL